eukprot:SAG22_NODE_86_length_21440_cov_288.248700_26_plen_47_part_00
MQLEFAMRTQRALSSERRSNASERLKSSTRCTLPLPNQLLAAGPMG